MATRDSIEIGHYQQQRGGTPRVMREIVLRGEPASTNEGRSFVASFLDQCGVPEDEAFDVLLAVTEAIGNAVRHGSPDKESRIAIRCQLKQADVVLEVSDDGAGFVYSDEMAELPDPTASCGRGFFLMKELMDDLEIDSSSSGTTVHMRHRLQSHAMTA